jgi:hypothetical protein
MAFHIEGLPGGKKAHEFGLGGPPQDLSPDGQFIRLWSRNPVASETTGPELP